MEISLTERDIIRFLGKLKRDERTGCLLYTGSKFPKGHGAFRLRNEGGKQRLVRAHHVAMFLAGRKIPRGYDAMHMCPAGDHPVCCENAHLEIGTRKAHGRDRSIKRQCRRSRKGLPFGAVRARNGRFAAQAYVGGKTRCYGTYDDWSVASAVARYHKNLALFPEAPEGRLADAS